MRFIRPSSLRYFSRYVKKYLLQESILVFLVFLSSLAALSSPYFLKIIIDDVFPSKNMRLLLFVVAVYAGVSLARIIITYVSNYLFAKVSNGIIKDIRIDVFSHLIRLPLSFHDQHKIGDTVHRINSEVNSIQNVLTSSIIRIINSTCTIIGLTVFLCLLNWKLFLVSLTIFPFIYINTRYFQPKIQHNIRLERKTDSQILNFLMESFSNIRLIKSYMSYAYEERKLNTQIDEQVALNLKNVHLTSMTRNISVLLTALVPMIILYQGGRDVMTGAMSIGALVAFIQYINRLFDPFRDLMGLYFDTLRAMVSMDRIQEILQVSPETNTPAHSLTQAHCPTIIFRDVSFHYGNSKPVLEKINLTFEPGKNYALVGSSGCGKSTVLSLICRFYDPVQGSITWDGAPAHELDLSELRGRINLVSQHNLLFHDTIRNNVAYGYEVLPDDMIENAVRQSCISDYIEGMPQKFDTVVGDQGSTLSGGQKQRLEIARSVLRRSACLLILDEATSAIDSETEKQILQNLYKENQDKTVILVSHRLSAVKDVDVIICLENGSVAEMGSHEELLTRKGYYWNLFKNQL